MAKNERSSQPNIEMQNFLESLMKLKENREKAIEESRLAAERARSADLQYQSGFSVLKAEIVEGRSTGNPVMDFAAATFKYKDFTNEARLEELRRKYELINALLKANLEEPLLVIKTREGCGSMLIEKDSDLGEANINLSGGIISGEQLRVDAQKGICIIPAVNPASIEYVNFDNKQRLVEKPLTMNPLYLAPSPHAYNSFRLIAGESNINRWVNTQIRGEDKTRVRSHIDTIFAKTS